MKKRIWIPIAAAIVLAILLIPVKSTWDDGSTQQWQALTYRVVRWNRSMPNGSYRNTAVYFGADCFQSLERLWEEEQARHRHTFTGVVRLLVDDRALVEPVGGENGECSVELIDFRTGALSAGVREGDVVEVTYLSGQAACSEFVHAIHWQIPGDLRSRNYPGTWVNKATACGYPGIFDFEGTIRRVYADCFFVSERFSDACAVKVNGVLPEDWCIGDRVRITYTNEFCDRRGRWECDMLCLEESIYDPDASGAGKPVIYLYPAEETEVSVKLTFDGRLTCTYPDYRDGWLVTAAPDGTLTDENGKTYSYLFWEGLTDTRWDMSRGFCVRGEDTAAFLEEALEKLGLNRREANEFIVYWLPLMQENPYNIISFQTDVYTEAAKLEISPSPDTLIRIFMAYQASETPVELPPQVLATPERTGFTVVEWGGWELP